MAVRPAKDWRSAGEKTTLSAAIDATQTTISVASAGTASVGLFGVKIDDEKLTVTAGLGTTTWTVVRGVDGTAAASHASGSAVELRTPLNAVGMEDAEKRAFDYTDAVRAEVPADGSAATASLRTQGTGASQSMPGTGHRLGSSLGGPSAGYAARVAEWHEGTTGAPVTGAGPTVKISRTEDLRVGTNAPNRTINEVNAALAVYAKSLATSEMQTNAIRGYCESNSTSEFDAASPLSATITAAATSLSVTSAAYFPAAPFTIQIDSEQMTVTAVAGNTFTVTRGVNGSTAATHSAAALVKEKRTGAGGPDAFALEGYGYSFASGTGAGGYLVGHRSKAVGHACGAELTSWNNAASTLLFGVGSGATAIRVVDPAPFPTTVPFTVRVADEVMTVTAVAGDTFTVTRTAGVTQSVGAPVVVDGVYNTAGSSDTMGLWLASRGGGHNGVGVALGDVGSQWRVGIGLTEGSVKDYGFRDDSNSSISLAVLASHLIGLDLFEGTYSTVALRFPSAAGLTNGMQWGADSVLYKAATGVLSVDDTVLELLERTQPGAPAANRARLYVDDNGAGKTRLMVRFATGVSQVVATQP